MNRSDAATANDEENIGSSQPREESAGDTNNMITGATYDNSKDTSSQGPSSSRTKLFIIFAVIIIAVVIALALILTKPWNKDGGPNGTMPPTKTPTTSSTLWPTATPTLRPTTTFQNIADILGVENLDSLNVTSPEFQALEWMTFQDHLSNELLVATSEGSNRMILSERYAVAVLYYATNGVSWDDQFNFLSETSICDWNNGVPLGNSGDEGIYCNGQGMVVDIELGYNGLSGTIPSQLGKLLSLESLNLFKNDLRGTVPDALGVLTRLTYLDVSFNNILGTIPDALGALTQMTALHVGFNELMGTIPDALAALTQLTWLRVSENELTGTVPLAFQSLTALELLSLNSNILTGNLDPIFCPRPTTLHTLWADCREPNPEIICSCCTFCF